MRFTQRGTALYGLTIVLGALFTIAAFATGKWFALLGLPVGAIVAYVFAPVTLDIDADSLTVAFRVNYFARSFGWADITECTVTQHYGNLGYRVGLWHTFWVASWGDAVKFKSGGRTFVAGCDRAEDACREISARAAQAAISDLTLDAGASPA